MPNSRTPEFMLAMRQFARNHRYVNYAACKTIGGRANGYGGKPIRPNNLFTFFKGSHPQGEGMSAEKLDRVALALGHRLAFVHKDSVIVEKQKLKRLENALNDANSALARIQEAKT